MCPKEEGRDLLEEVVAEIRKDFSNVSMFEEKLQDFLEAYEKKFPHDRSGERGAADAFFFALFSHVVCMSSMGYASQGLVEMHAILESYSRRQIVGHISSAKGRKIVGSLVDRQSLDSMAHSLRELGVLTDEDVKLTSRLTQFRNGLAHRNDKPIRELMHLSKDVHSLDVWHAASKVDWIPYQLGSIRYMINLSNSSGGAK